MRGSYSSQHSSVRKIIAYSESGNRVGESNRNAKLTDAQVDEIRDLREDKNYSYTQLAQTFHTPKSTIVAICKYRRRALTPVKWKTEKN